MASPGIVSGLASPGTASQRTAQVSPANAAVFAGAVLVIVCVMLVATLIPARRAAQTDPAVVLRGE
jgi:ABC-type lipoprotein release transport system permease subunit